MSTILSDFEDLLMRKWNFIPPGFHAPVTIFSWQDFLWDLPPTCPVSGEVLLLSCTLDGLGRMQLWQCYWCTLGRWSSGWWQTQEGPTMDDVIGKPQDESLTSIHPLNALPLGIEDILCMGKISISTGSPTFIPNGWHHLAWTLCIHVLFWR